jgi:peptidoglycan/xylan/chitin deacetylase (PgdA/CDA1 family)
MPTTFKMLTRVSLAEAAKLTGILAHTERTQHRVLTILCYHHVLPRHVREQYYDPDLVVTPEAFAQHCKMLKAHYEVLPLRKALHRMLGSELQVRPLAAVTFDDGYRDNYRYAAPVLTEHSVNATFFVIAGLVDTDEVPWYDAVAAAWDVGARVKSRGPASTASAKEAVAWAKCLTTAKRAEWMAELLSKKRREIAVDSNLIMRSDELLSLARVGHEIGSHSLTHPLLLQIDEGAMCEELEGSRSRLVHLLRQPVSGFCYPNGDHNALVHEAVRKAGYDYAVTMDPGVNPQDMDEFQLRRWFVHEERLRGMGGDFSATIARVEWSGLGQRLYRRSWQ